VASNGRHYAVWTEEIAPGQHQLCSSIAENGVWEPTVRFYMGSHPALATGSDGSIHLTYQSQVFGKWEIYHTTWLNGNWLAPQNISNTSASSQQPDIILTAENVAVIVWMEGAEGASRIYYAWQAEETWNTYWVPASVDGRRPSIALDAYPYLWVVWESPEVGLMEREIYAIRGNYADGITWSPLAINLSDSTLNDSTQACITGTASNGAYIVWQEQTADGLQVFYADTSEPGMWWTEPERLSVGDSETAQPHICAGIAGPIHAMWEQDGQLYHRYRLPSGAWSPRDAVSATDDTLDGLAMAVSADQRLSTIWAQSIGGGAADVYHRQGAYTWPHQLWLPLTAD